MGFADATTEHHEEFFEMTAKLLSIPDPCLVVLVGGDDGDRQEFARMHFSTDEIFTLVMGATREDIAASLRSRSMTVVDAQNLSFEERLVWYNLARELHTAAAAVVVAPERASKDNPFRDVLRRAAKSIRKGEGLYAHAVVTSPSLDDVEIIRHKLPSDMRDDHGPFDIIGDVHGCRDELEELLTKLGWTVTWSSNGDKRRPELFHPQERKIILLGDLVDRGPHSVDTLLLAEHIVSSGLGHVVLGNHDERLRRWLDGRKVKVSYGLEQTISSFRDVPADMTKRLKAFLDSLPSHLVLDGGALVVAHAGLTNGMALGSSIKVNEFAIFGKMQLDDDGQNERVDWARDYTDEAVVVYGHMAQESASWRNNTICIDTSCVFGGELTALRWPERELVSVPAHEIYHPREREVDDLPSLGSNRSP